jgi:hypothetical protein
MRGQAKSGREDRRGHRSPAEHESVAGRAAAAAARRANDCRRSVRSTRAQRHRRAGSPFHGEEAKLPKGCGAFRTADQTVAAHICRTRVCRAKPVACVSGRVTQRGLLPPRPARGVVGHLHGGLVMPIQEEACAPASRSVSDRSVDQLLGLRMSCAFAPPSSVLLILLCRCHDFHYSVPCILRKPSGSLPRRSPGTRHTAYICFSTKSTLASMPPCA